MTIRLNQATRNFSGQVMDRRLVNESLNHGLTHPAQGVSLMQAFHSPVHTFRGRVLETSRQDGDFTLNARNFAVINGEQ